MNLNWNTALRGATLLCLTVLMVTQFNNCGTYSTPDNSQDNSSTLACTNVACITPTLDNLSINLHVGGGMEYKVPTGLSEWNLAGDCNEGGYPYNRISWEMYWNGQRVRTSDYPGMILGNSSATANSLCINGRYSLYLNMKPIVNDALDRSGLNDGTGNPATGGRSNYDLYIEIVGLDSPNGVANRNTVSGRIHVTLIPVL